MIWLSVCVAVGTCKPSIPRPIVFLSLPFSFCFSFFLSFLLLLSFFPSRRRPSCQSKSRAKEKSEKNGILILACLFLTSTNLFEIENNSIYDNLKNKLTMPRGSSRISIVTFLLIYYYCTWVRLLKLWNLVKTSSPYETWLLLSTV